MKAAFAVIALLLLAGCSTGQASNLQSESSTSTTGAVASESVREIPVRVFQFGFDPEVINVKKGEKVRLVFTSTDVKHGFSIPEYGIDVLVPAGASVPYEFVADKAGSFNAYCSFPCGSGHINMKATLVVE